MAGLAAELPDFVPALVGVAQRGRSLGLHLVLATQRPAGVVTDDIRANTNLGSPCACRRRPSPTTCSGADAAELPRDRPGRAVLRFGPGECVVAQVAVGRHGVGEGGPPVTVALLESSARPRRTRSSEAGPTALEGLVDVVAAAGPGGCTGERHPPWPHRCLPTSAGRTWPRARPGCSTIRTTRPSGRGGGTARPVTCCASVVRAAAARKR